MADQGVVQARCAMKDVGVPHPAGAAAARARLPAACAALALVLATCGREDGPAPGLLDPASSSVSGYLRVIVRTSLLGVDPSSVVGATFGGVRAYGLEPVGGDLAVTVQGHPDGGLVPVVLHTAGGDVTLPQRFEYVPPSHPALARVVGFGASLTQGIQRTVPSLEGTLASPVALVARQVGAYMPLPLPVPGLFSEEGVSDVGPPPTCALPDTASMLLRSAGQVMERLADPETGEYSCHLARVDPGIEVRNLAAGNCSLDEMLHGVRPDNLAGGLLSHLVYDPYSEPLAPVRGTQMERIQALRPTLVMSTDFFGNDVLWAIVLGATIDPATATPEDVLLSGIRETVDTLAATRAEVFLANLPGTSLLPITTEKRRASIEAGVTDVDARIAAIDALAARANAALAEAAGRHQNVHVVDLAAWAARVAAEGIDAGGQHLSPAKFGGLVGLDGIHFTDAGYAAVANRFLEEINAALGTAFPPVDLDVVVAADPESPAALGAAGLGECLP